MKKLRCKICGREEVVENTSPEYHCPVCCAGIEYVESVDPANPFDQVEELEPESPVRVETYQETEEEDNRVRIDPDNPAIMRIMEKCIQCGNCKRTCENVVGIHYNQKQCKHAVCIHCGQCALSCPRGAIVPKYAYHHVREAIKNKHKVVIISTAPAVRVALGEEFGMEPGTFVEGKMVKALKKLGFDYVLDVTFGADLTIMEEAAELVDRIQHHELLPQFTSCCPSWVKYVEMYYPDLLPYLSTCKSPIAMQGSIIKSYFAQIHGIDPDNIVNVALTPCTAKKYECTRKELNYTDRFKDTDYVITTSELALWLRENKIDFKQLPEANYDSLLERGSGAGLIFGSTGGVMEAALRTVHKILTGQNPTDQLLQLKAVRGLTNVKEAEVTIQDTTLKVAVIHGIPNVIPFLEQLKQGTLAYDFIEVMNCRGGCLGGGGQPLVPIQKEEQVRQARMDSMYQQDEFDSLRCCHDNEDIRRLYEYYLEEPLSPNAERFLHTFYESKKDLLK